MQTVVSFKSATIIFEISIRKNQVQELIDYIKTTKLIGFNNVNYDYPVIHWLILNYKNYNNTEALLYQIYRHSQFVIATKYPAIRRNDDTSRFWIAFDNSQN